MKHLRNRANMVLEIKLEEDGVDPHGVGGKYGYRIGHSDGTYTVPDRVLNTVEDRPVGYPYNELFSGTEKMLISLNNCVA